MAGAPRPRSGNTTLHRDGTVSYWSVYDQRWHRSRAIPDRELAAMDPASRRRVSRHTAKRNPARRQARSTPKGTANQPAAFLLGAVPHAWDTGVPLPYSWQGYALSDPEDGTQWVMYLGRSGGERSYSAIKRWAPDARRKRNGVGSYQGVRYVRKAGVIRYKDPETGRKMKIAQREGGMREFRRRVERYLRRAA